MHFNGLVADVKFKGWVMRCCFIRVWANRIVHLEINEVDGFEWMVHNYDSFLIFYVQQICFKVDAVKRFSGTIPNFIIMFLFYVNFLVRYLIISGI